MQTSKNFNANIEKYWLHAIFVFSTLVVGTHLLGVFMPNLKSFVAFCITLLFVAILYGLMTKIMHGESLAMQSAARMREKRIEAKEEREISFLAEYYALDLGKMNLMAAMVAFISFVVSAYGLLPIMPNTPLGVTMALGVSGIGGVAIYLATSVSMSLIRYYGFIGLACAALIWVPAGYGIYYTSTLWFISAISAQKTQIADYRAQMNAIDTAVNQAFDAVNRDKSLAPVLRDKENRWFNLANAEKENGQLTGSAGEGQAYTALVSVANNFKEARASLEEFSTTQQAAITSIGLDLLSTKQALDLNEEGFTTFQRRMQDLRAKLGRLQGNRPLVALSSAISSLDQFLVIQPSANAELAERQQLVLANITNLAQQDSAELKRLLTQVQTRAEVEIPSIINRSPLERLDLHAGEVRMQKSMGVTSDYIIPGILMLAVLFSRRQRRPKLKQTKILHTPNPPVRSKGFNQLQPGQQQQPEPIVPVQQVKPAAPEVEAPAKSPVQAMLQRAKTAEAEEQAAPEMVKPVIQAPAPVIAQPKVSAPQANKVSEAEKLKKAAQKLAQEDFAAGREKYTQLLSLSEFNLKAEANSTMGLVKQAYDTAWDEANAAKKPKAAVGKSTNGGATKALAELAQRANASVTA